jgi:hypothetical protein
MNYLIKDLSKIYFTSNIKKEQKYKRTSRGIMLNKNYNQGLYSSALKVKTKNINQLPKYNKLILKTNSSILL